MSGYPAWRFGMEKKSPQSIWLWRPVRLDCRGFTGLRETASTLGECTQVSCVPVPRTKAVTLLSPGKAYLHILEGILGMQWREAVAHSGNKGTGGRGMEGIYWHEISWRPKFWQQNLAPLNRLQVLVLGHFNSNNQQGGNTATPISRQAV